MKEKTLNIAWEHLELMIWITGITVVCVANPIQEHFSICLIKMAGLGYCPGCGLGHSIGFFVRGDFLSSFHAHPMGIPAFVFIVLRIFKLSKPIYHNILKTKLPWTLYS